MRRAWHWPTIAPISISATFSQLPCFGVQWICSRSAMPRLRRLERLVQRRRPVRVQVVHDQHHPFVRVVRVYQVPDQVRPVDLRAPLRDLDPRQPSSGANSMKQVARAVALVLVVVDRRRSWRGGPQHALLP